MRNARRWLWTAVAVALAITVATAVHPVTHRSTGGVTVADDEGYNGGNGKDHWPFAP